MGSSGSIATSPQIDVQASAYFDVSLVSGGFTLGSSQTLKGNGTVLGAVTASGTVAPGASIGTLTFANAPTLSGTTSMEIDRNGGSPVSDKLVLSSGTLAYNSSALTIVNLGATLQNGDSFDLFDAASFSGSFTSISPSTARHRLDLEHVQAHG